MEAGQNPQGQNPRASGRDGIRTKSTGHERWPEKEYRGVKKGKEFGASKPAKPNSSPALPTLPQLQSMPLMVPGIRKSPKGQQTKRRTCLCGCPQTAVEEAPTALLSIIRFLSLRLKPNAATAPRAGRGPGTFVSTTNDLILPLELSARSPHVGAGICDAVF